ncbi:hypothetical protein L1987_06234 [Smallanthus sonchifolius]|uniref:Uncharacterized protein n=1 Tax=Smallanthus sonchifolius TaxID=185202 RepID=A0ACB9JXT1_9ASTR|nr:hypothetical protein L1987_06234 [Smallanthus sonchifolius]
MSSQFKNISVSAPSSSSGLVNPIPPPPFQKSVNQPKKTTSAGFSGSGILAGGPIEKVKESKKPVEVMTPLQPKILDFNYSRSLGIHNGVRMWMMDDDDDGESGEMLILMNDERNHGKTRKKGETSKAPRTA